MRFGLVLVALAGAPLAGQAAPDHDHDHSHTHRGPGPHFIDAFFTENAYIERKLRPDFVFASGDGQSVATARLEVEWAVHRRASLILHAPVHRLMPDGGPTATGIGDVSVGGKLALVNDRRRFILAAGADALLPTGDETRGLGEEHAAAAPFVLAWLPFGGERRWLVQGAVHADIPLGGEEGTHWETSGALSWTSPLGITPMVEVALLVPPGGAASTWSMAPGVRWEFAPAWEIGAAVRLPVGGPREEQYRIVAGLIRHFPLPQ